jgi:L-gulono-1,4-lactone dehydrogenase
LSPTWHNHARNQKCKPRGLCRCHTLEDLVELVRRAESEDTTVRAVGAGHAWSDVALTEGYLVCPNHLGGVLELDDGTLRHPPPRLARVLAGTHLYALNAALDKAGLALPQMGGYDGQTIAGVVSTSTHGSGLKWGAFPDLVHSIELVVAGGEVVRVERTDGPTDRTRFEATFAGTRTLIQDDDTFNSAVCGMGCMGIVWSYLIEVREKFWLKEARTLSTWEDTRETLTTRGVLGEGDHYELFVNPYPRDDGKHNLLVTRRCDADDPGGPPDTREHGIR